MITRLWSALGVTDETIAEYRKRCDTKGATGLAHAWVVGVAPPVPLPPGHIFVTGLGPTLEAAGLDRLFITRSPTPSRTSRAIDGGATAVRWCDWGVGVGATLNPFGECGCGECGCWSFASLPAHEDSAPLLSEVDATLGNTQAHASKQQTAAYCPLSRGVRPRCRRLTGAGSPACLSEL